MGLLNKKYYTVPDNKRYDFNINKAIAWVLFVIVVLGIAKALSSCSLEKKIAKTYRNAEAYNPLTKTDSLHLLRASKKVIKASAPPKVTPPKTITVKVPVKTYILDTSRLKFIEDSLGIASSENINGIVDDCIKSVNTAKSEGIKIGIKEGYNQRNKELQKDGVNVQLPSDTIPPDLETIAELADCQFTSRMYQDSTLYYRTLYNDKKKQAKERFWLILALIGSLAVSVFFNVKQLPKMNK